MPLTLTPGAVTLSQLAAIAAGRDAARLDPATRERVEASAARGPAVAAGAAAGYGITTCLVDAPDAAGE